MLAFPGCSPRGETPFLGWIKVDFTIKRRKYDGNEKIGDRIRYFLRRSFKGLRPHVASIKAEELTPTHQKDRTGRVLITLYPETIVEGVLYHP